MTIGVTDYAGGVQPRRHRRRQRRSGRRVGARRITVVEQVTSADDAASSAPMQRHAEEVLGEEIGRRGVIAARPEAWGSGVLLVRAPSRRLGRNDTGLYVEASSRASLGLWQEMGMRRASAGISRSRTVHRCSRPGGRRACRPREDAKGRYPPLPMRAQGPPTTLPPARRASP